MREPLLTTGRDCPSTATGSRGAGGCVGAVVVVGSVNLDLSVVTPHLPAPGETVQGATLSRQLGGKGANQAIAAARAGARVTLIAAVGADDPGDKLVNEIADWGVDTQLIRRVDGTTGTAVITVDHDGENTVVVLPGANHGLTDLTDADANRIRESNVLLVQLEIPLSAVTAAIRVAVAARVTVVLNPSPLQPLSPELLAGVDVLVVNEGEAAQLGEHVKDLHLIITRGGRGASYRGEAGRFDVAAPIVEPVDTTGAGDAFTGALATAWARGHDPRSALVQGCAAGSATAAIRGAHPPRASTSLSAQSTLTTPMRPSPAPPQTAPGSH